MTLRDVIKSRNDLVDLCNSISLEKYAIKRLMSLGHYAANNPTATVDLTDVKQQLNEAIKLSSTMVESLQTKIHQLAELADQQASNMFDGWDLDQVHPESVSLKDLLSKQVLERIKTRIKTYCDWHYPALQIGCRDKFWTDYMVTGDPLYLTNYHRDTLNQVSSGYPVEYQRRLRLYDIPFAEIPTRLPVGQFNFVLAWEVLNYTKQSDIDRVLEVAWTMLKPGGTFMFSYNNCDLSDSAHLADGLAMSYTNRRHIEAQSKTIGYEVTAFEDHTINHDYYQTFSWCELKRPGRLATAKAHQSLGTILVK